MVGIVHWTRLSVALHHSDEREKGVGKIHVSA
jgi:hypothetical protein